MSHIYLPVEKVSLVTTSSYLYRERLPESSCGCADIVSNGHFDIKLSTLGKSTRLRQELPPLVAPKHLVRAQAIAMQRLMLDWDQLNMHIPQYGRGRQKSCYRPSVSYAITLPGPSGGHCVELKGDWARKGESRHTLGPEGPQRARLFLHLKAPRSGPRRAPGGSVQTGTGR